jgi:hypothetical protein
MLLKVARSVSSLFHASNKTLRKKQAARNDSRESSFIATATVPRFRGNRNRAGFHSSAALEFSDFLAAGCATKNIFLLGCALDSGGYLDENSVVFRFQT